MSVEVAVSRPFQFDNRNETDIDWEHPQNARVSFAMRLSNAFFANEWCSDMSFYVPMDDRKVPAHTLIVASASPVLQRCCFGTGFVTGGRTVTVPDYCTTEVLLIVLRYLYTGGVAEGIDGSNVCLVLKIADCYELCDLQKQCDSTIRSILSSSTVCMIFNQIHQISNVSVRRCMRYMQLNTCDIFDNGTAMDMEDEALKKLLNANNRLSMSETELATAMIKWADTQCLSKSIAISPTNRRQVLGERLKMVNFGAMGLSEFLDCVDMFGDGCFTDSEILLTTKQIHRIAKRKINDGTIAGPFASKRRLAVYETTCNISDKNSIVGRHTEHTFSMSVFHMKQPFTLTGLSLDQMNRQIEHITNNLTHDVVPFIMQDKFAMLNVKPDENGIISLTLKTNRSAAVFPIMVLETTHPKMKGSFTCVSSFKYNNPKRFEFDY